MKVATKRLAGRSFSSFWLANCCSTPPSMTAMRSARALASVWSWVTKIEVMPALAEEVLDAAAQHGAQLRLELAHRLVEEIEIGVAHQRAGEAGALLLAARDRGRIALEDAPRSRPAWRSRRPSASTSPCGSREALQGEGDVVAHGERRIERIALEGHGDVALAGGRVSMRRPASVIEPLRHVLEAGDHAQRRGLAAARRAEQRDDLALLDRPCRDVFTACTRRLAAAP